MPAANMAILRALELNTTGASFQRAKWMWKQGSAQQAISYLTSEIEALSQAGIYSQKSQSLLTGKVIWVYCRN